MRVIWLLGINLFVGCQAQAPEDYDALISYMVEHYHEDPAYLEDGVEQLFTLLDDDVAKKLGRGKRMQTLTSEAVERWNQTWWNSQSCWVLFVLVIFRTPLKIWLTPTWSVLGMSLPIQTRSMSELSGRSRYFVDGECEDLEYEATLQRFYPWYRCRFYFQTHIR